MVGAPTANMSTLEQEPSCPDENALASYVERTADPARMARIADHIDGCPSCRRIVSSLLRDFDDSTPSVRPIAMGTRVGRYRITEVLGAGAMGIVYAAVDPDLERAVALKLIRQPVDSNPGARRRWLLEGRALGRLSHPNVVSVYDVGTFGPHVFITMELIRGKTLRRWVDTCHPDPEEIWRALLDAARGLAAAHDADVIHRDFKPDNVLVGDDGRVCVTDFGLATGISPTTTGSTAARPDEGVRDDVGGASLVTKDGLLVGTPRYMAPEQAIGKPCDASSDQYSFCVVVRELLRDDYTLHSIRGSAIERGLAEKPEDRWPDMDALIDVLANGPNRARRTRRVVVGALALALAGVAGTVAWQGRADERCSGADAAWAGTWNEARRVEIDAALREAAPTFGADVSRRVVARLDEYGATWRSEHTQACVASTIRGERSVALMDLQMRCLEHAKVHVGAAVEILGRASEQAAVRALELVESLPPLDRCGDLEALRAEVDPPSLAEQEAVETIRHLSADALARQRVGDFTGAKTLVDEAVTRLEGIAFPSAHAEVAMLDGMILYRLGSSDAAVVRLQETLSLAATARDWEIAGDAARALMNVLGVEMKQFEAALHYRPLAESLTGNDPRRRVHQHVITGGILLGQGELADAEAHNRRALAVAQTSSPRSHALVLLARHAVAQSLHAAGKYEEAEAQLRDALEEGIAALGANHPDVASLHGSLGAILGDQGKAALAEAEFRRALAINEAAYGPAHPLLAQLRTNLAASMMRQGKHEQAIEVARRALAECERAYGPDHPMTVTARLNLASHASQHDDLDAAKQLAEDALGTRERTLGASHSQTAIARSTLAEISARLGEYDVAEAQLAVAVHDLDETLGTDHPLTARTRATWAKVLIEQGRSAAALSVAEQAWASLQSHPSARAQYGAPTAAALARALWATGTTPDQHARALDLAEEAIRLFRDADASSDEVADLERWMRETLPGPVTRPATRDADAG